MWQNSPVRDDKSSFGTKQGWGGKRSFVHPHVLTCRLLAAWIYLILYKMKKFKKRTQSLITMDRQTTENQQSLRLSQCNSLSNFSGNAVSFNRDDRDDQGKADADSWKAAQCNHNLTTQQQFWVLKALLKDTTEIVYPDVLRGKDTVRRMFLPREQRGEGWFRELTQRPLPYRDKLVSSLWIQED